VPFTDRNLTCVDCGATFVFTAEDQEYHQRKGFANEPRRCRSCRSARRAQREGDSYSPAPRRSRELFTVTCDQCGKDAEVPFQPRGDRPVYCSDCFSSRAGTGSRGVGWDR
jgi:CxxC-x17-CxxC domain-containing protein